MNMKIRNDMDTVYIGYDPREHAAYEVLKFSIEIRAKNPVRIIPLKNMKNGVRKIYTIIFKNPTHIF